MSSFTRLGVELLDWPPYVACSLQARALWLGLYISREAKRVLVGMFHGGISSMAEAARISASEAAEGLSELQERQLVEHDPLRRLVRMVALPDKGERPFNGSVIRMWWRKWNELPDCSIRSRHLSLLEWLAIPLEQKSLDVWSATFGSVVSGTKVDTVSNTVGSTVSDRNLNLFEGGGHGVPHGVGPREYGDRIRERGVEREGGFAEGSVVQPPLVDLNDGEITIRSMLEAIARGAGGRFQSGLVDARLAPSLAAVVRQCSQNALSLDDLELGGRFLRAGGLAHRDDLGASWASKPGSVLGLVASAQAWNKGELRLDERDEERNAQPAPISAFTTGLRSL